MKTNIYIFLLTTVLLCTFSKKAESSVSDSSADTTGMRAVLDSLTSIIEKCKTESNYENFDEYVFKGLEISYQLKDTASIARYQFETARCYSNTMRSADALTYLNKSLKIAQEIKDTVLLGDIYNQMGMIYAEAHINDMAVDYLNKKLKIDRAKNDENSIIETELIIALIKGDLYEQKNDTATLLEALKKCEEHYQWLLDNPDQINIFVNVCSNVPKMYINAMEFSDEKRAAEFLAKADTVYCAGLRQFSNHPVVKVYMFPAKIALFCAKKNFQAAKKSLDSFNRHESEYANYVYVYAACTYYKAVNDYPNYLKFSSENRLLNHRNFSTEMCAKNERNQSQSQYEAQLAVYEKNAKERDTLFKLDSERSAMRNNGMIAVIVIVLLIAVIKVLQLRRSSRQNLILKKTNDDINFRNRKLQELQVKILSQTEEIKTQNALIEEQRNNLKDINEHLVGSIRYAQRIQKAAVPSKEMMDKIFPENFVFWQPKDIVSGDFYWAATDDSRKYLITADCTGHGVPGALLSMLGISVISDCFAAITPQTTAGEILDAVKNKFLESWAKSGGNIEDGIDMALMVVDSKNNTLQYAGAKRPLVMVRNNEASVIKPDKLCIGYNLKKIDKNFTNYVINTEKGDMFYAFSDGIPDQFGGEDGKAKFSQKNLLELLSNISDFAPDIQQASIKANVANWMDYDGKKTKQLDDQILIGIRV